MHTLLPLPVAPAINKCGISAKSEITDCPPVPLPKAIGSLAFDLSFLLINLLKRSASWSLKIPPSKKLNKKLFDRDLI